ncbi:MAG: carboxypeptidase-like regulatory domain-containing protein [Zavarzinella sp.]
MKVLTILLMFCAVVSAEEESVKTDILASESLRDIHDRGAKLYNDGDPLSCYRMFQGGLEVAARFLKHRPELQKRIAERTQKIDVEQSMAKKAFLMHELIEEVRTELRKKSTGSKVEVVDIPPRNVPDQQKKTPMVPQVKDVDQGVVGKLLLNGKPIPKATIWYVTLGANPPRVYQTQTTEQGGYQIKELAKGNYLVLVTSDSAKNYAIPAEYGLASSTPLKFELKDFPAKIDLLLNTR